MKRVKVIFINLVMLTAASLLMRTIAISFQVYLSNKISSAGIGLFQLVMSVYFLSITFATSGVRLAVTRLVAEEIGTGFGVKKALHNCLFYSIFFSITAGTVLFFSAQFIGENWLCDARTVLSLRILAFSLPFLSVSSVFGGYFTAVRRAIKAASVQIAEQLVRIFVTVGFLSIFLNHGLEYACAAMAAGCFVGEICSFLFLYTIYKFDARRFKSDRASANLIPRMFNIAIPVALSAYVTSIIRTVQHLIIPFGLKKSGASSESALSTYGLIHGMVVPVLMYPSVLLETISDLLIPELAECQACGSKKRLNYIINRVFKLGILFSIYVMFVFLCFSNELGLAIYKSKEAAFYMRILAPIIPIMYLDIVADGMLKGIGEQVSSMRYNIIDSTTSVALLYFLLPKYAIAGYLFTLFFARALNFSLSIRRLSKNVEFSISLANITKAIICVISSIIISTLLPDALKSVNISLYLVFAITALIYFVLLRLLSCITHDDVLWLKSLIK